MGTNYPSKWNNYEIMRADTLSPNETHPTCVINNASSCVDERGAFVSDHKLSQRVNGDVSYVLTSSCVEGRSF
jgi:hypothetical protein